MRPELAVGVIGGAYLLGSVSFGYLTVRLLHGRDIRKEGSGSAGATNVYRSAGAGAGLAVLLLDFAKGAAAVVLARALGAPAALVGAAALAVAVGHSFPIYFGFRGGKGVATSTGAFAALVPLAAVVAVTVFVMVVVWRRFVSLGSIVSAAMLPVLVYLLGPEDFELNGVEGGGWVLLSAVALSSLVLLLHGSNLRRLVAGTEPRLGDGRGIEGGEL